MDVRQTLEWDSQQNKQAADCSKSEQAFWSLFWYHMALPGPLCSFLKTQKP